MRTFFGPALVLLFAVPCWIFLSGSSGSTEPDGLHAAEAAALETARSPAVETDEALLAVTVLDAASGATLADFPLFFEANDPGEATRVESWTIRARRRGTMFDSDEAGGITIRTDADGRARITIPAGLALAFRSLDPNRPLRESDETVSPRLAAGGVSILELHAVDARPRPFHGRILATAIGEVALPGARVRASSNRVTPASLEADTSGRFRVEGARWDGDHLVVEADGFAPAYLALGSGHDTPATAAVLRLREGASLRGVVRGPDGPCPRAEVRVEARTAELEGGAVGSGRFPAQHAWTLTSGADGAFRLDGLAASTELRVTVTPEGGVPVLLPEPLSLLAGENRSHDLVLGNFGALRGVVRDENGRTVAGAEVFVFAPELGHADLPAPFYLQRMPKELAGSAVTDGAGRFEVSGLLSGEWLVGVRAAEADGPAISPVANRVAMPLGAPRVETSIEVATTSFLSGQVVGASGESDGRALVFVWSKDGRGSLSAPTTADGSFRIGPLLAGEHGIKAMPLHANGGSSPEQTVRAGDSGVRLRLAQAASLAVEVLGVGPASGRAIGVRVARRDEAGERFEEARVDGTTEFGQLAPGRYDVMAFGSGWFGIVPDVELRGGDTPHVQVRLEPAGELLLYVPEDGRVERVRVRSRGALIESARLAPGERQRVLVPPGAVEVERWPATRGANLPLTADVRAGEERALALSFD